MKAVTVIPGIPESLRPMDVPKPSPGKGRYCSSPLVGVCGTDKEIIEVGMARHLREANT